MSACNGLTTCAMCVRDNTCVWSDVLTPNCVPGGLEGPADPTMNTAVGNNFKYGTCITSAPFIIIFVAIMVLVIIPLLGFGCWKYRKHIRKKYKAARDGLAQRNEFFGTMKGMGNKWGKDAQKGAERSNVGYTAQVDDGDRSQAGKQRGLMDRLQTNFRK